LHDFLRQIVTFPDLGRPFVISCIAGRGKAAEAEQENNSKTYKMEDLVMYSVERRNSWLPSIFSNLFDDDFTVMPARQFASPAVNIKESEKEFQIEIAAPGMTKDDFRVHVNDQDQLVISVEKKHENKEEDKNTKYLRREFNYMRFEQALQLPEHVDKAAITAKACSGVLHIELPKLATMPEKKPARVIEIQ
jgi:HSP20 family protein